MFSTIHRPSVTFTWITFSLLPSPMSTNGNSSAPMCTALGAFSVTVMGWSLARVHAFSPGRWAGGEPSRSASRFGEMSPLEEPPPPHLMNFWCLFIWVLVEFGALSASLRPLRALTSFDRLARQSIGFLALWGCDGRIRD